MSSPLSGGSALASKARRCRRCNGMFSKKPWPPTWQPSKWKLSNSMSSNQATRPPNPSAPVQAEKCSCIFCIHHIPVVCRPQLPDPLPRTEIRHEPENCVCKKCGNTALVKIGEDVTEQLHVESAKFSVIRHVRPQYACRPCETVIAAPIPPAVIDGGIATVGLLTWVMIGKYQDHLPLYRLEQIAARDNVILASSTLAEWVGPRRLGLATLGRPPGLAPAARRRLTCRRDPGGATRSRQGKPKKLR